MVKVDYYFENPNEGPQVVTHIKEDISQAIQNMVEAKNYWAGDKAYVNFHIEAGKYLAKTNFRMKIGSAIEYLVNFKNEHGIKTPPVKRKNGVHIEYEVNDNA